MGYRSIEVDGQTYEYVVGPYALKVKGIGVRLREFNERDWEITPDTVKSFIQLNKKN